MANLVATSLAMNNRASNAITTKLQPAKSGDQAGLKKSNSYRATGIVVELVFRLWVLM